MILLTGGTSFNAKEFVNNYDEEFFIIHHKNKVKINNSNVIYLNSVKELKKLNKINEINTIVNFASSINSKNNLYNNFLSSFFYLLRIYFVLKKFNLGLIINIGSMWQDVPKMRFKSYVVIKNLTDFVFIKLSKKVNYLTIKLGDTYGVDDSRNKLVKILKDQLVKEKLELKGSETNLVFPIHTKTLSKIVEYIIKNKSIFINSNVKKLRAYIEPYTLLEFVNLFSIAHNFNKEILFGKSRGIYYEDLKPDSDFCFLIHENMIDTLKDI